MMRTNNDSVITDFGRFYIIRTRIKPTLIHSNSNEPTWRPGLHYFFWGEYSKLPMLLLRHAVTQTATLLHYPTRNIYLHYDEQSQPALQISKNNTLLHLSLIRNDQTKRNSLLSSQVRHHYCGHHNRSFIFLNKYNHERQRQSNEAIRRYSPTIIQGNKTFMSTSLTINQLVLT